MNERIKELAEQAGFYPENNWDHTKWHAAGHNPTFEKFAELIVRECIQFTGHPDSIRVKSMKSHFGIDDEQAN